MDARIHPLNEQPRRGNGQYVLYWAQMNRRVDSNHALEYAVGEANRLRLPVLMYEAVTCTYPYANDRFHTFLLEGVEETARRAARRGLGYQFYLRKTRADANDILYRLAKDAALVVSDDYPTFVAAAHNASVPSKLDVAYVVVDSSCVVPMRLIETKQYGAYTLRPKIKRLLPQYLRPVETVEVKRGWQGPVPLAEFHTEVTAEAIPALVAACDIDHTVKPSLSFQGGRLAAERHLRAFLDTRLSRYASERNEPAAHATSNLSPWLHFGHISSLEVALAAKMEAEDRGGSAEEFLEELIVRRELAFNHARFAGNDTASLRSLPDWARKTLREHAADARDPVYTRDEFERALTHDALWNATQKEMLLRGKIHGYYRMYWGKKIIEWSASHEEALDTMVYLHDRYALDGRDPNTYTNILWCFGLHDRPWQTRPIFGMLRYMSLEGMKRKTGVDAYLREIAYLEATKRDPHRIQ
jgi:deoxyribodipyrimidine photo-lyase